ncbi:unnamed protein product [Mytilus edulis]|uniref:B box-type domain-containing protein n=1 Tax=Mytilus edulis TaxID=6550 RepID=A0A8S3V926_MYTED|nr:unnamed protein product [Mytilus edulis]
MKTFNGHEVFALDDFELSMDHVSEFSHAGMCSLSNHQKNQLTLFCAGPECQKPICYSCCLTCHMPTDNKKHITRDIEEVYTEKVKSMIEQKDKILKTERELVDLSKRINEQLDRLAANADTTKKEIQAIFRIAVKILVRRRDLLMENTDKLTKEKSTLLKKQDTEVINLIDTIRDACRFLEQSVATKNQSAFLLLSKTISDRFNYLQDNNFDTQPRDCNLILFTKANLASKLQQFVDTFGNIFSSSAFGPKTKVTFPIAIETDKDFDIIIELFDNDDAQLSLTHEGSVPEDTHDNAVPLKRARITETEVTSSALDDTDSEFQVSQETVSQLSQSSEASVSNSLKLESLNKFLSISGISPVKELNVYIRDSSTRTQQRYISKAKQCMELMISTICPGEEDFIKKQFLMICLQKQWRKMLHLKH